ncbi:MAG: pyruvate dehydrogenase complex dihydrolipoamide acetyltransferase [Planctomycetota bacterium]
MITELELPGLSPTMEEGTIASWHVKPGDKVSAGEVIAEVQTDKAVMEWEAMDDGYLAEVLVQEGEQAKVNMVVALLSSEKGEDLGDAADKARAKNQELASGGTEPASEETPPPPEQPDPSEAPDGREPQAPFAGGAVRAAEQDQAALAQAQQQRAAGAAAEAAPVASSTGHRVSPVAARMASANGLSLGDVTGTGPDGRIVKQDVLNALAAGPKRAGPGRNGNPFLRGGAPDYEDIALSPMRQVIGRRLLESKQRLPHFQVTERVLVDRLVALRAELNANEGVKISVNDLVLKAVALTLVRHTNVNATFDGQRIRRWNTADISVAVSIPDGLITPVVHGAEKLTLSQINVLVKDLAKRAQAGTLKPEEYQGGSFTISNMGMFGIEQFNAIINPPQAAILAIGGIKDEPVVVDGELQAGKAMRLTVSADHRVVDGADAARFLQDLRELLERPASLML